MKKIITEFQNIYFLKIPSVISKWKVLILKAKLTRTST